LLWHAFCHVINKRIWWCWWWQHTYTWVKERTTIFDVSSYTQ